MTGHLRLGRCSSRDATENCGWRTVARLETKNVTSSVQSVIMAVAAQRHMPWPVLEMCPQPCQETFRSAWEAGRACARACARAQARTQPHGLTRSLPDDPGPRNQGDGTLEKPHKSRLVSFQNVRKWCLRDPKIWFGASFGPNMASESHFYAFLTGF